MEIELEAPQVQSFQEPGPVLWAKVGGTNLRPFVSVSLFNHFLISLSSTSLFTSQLQLFSHSVLCFRALSPLELRELDPPLQEVRLHLCL